MGCVSRVVCEAACLFVLPGPTSTSSPGRRRGVAVLVSRSRRRLFTDVSRCAGRRGLCAVLPEAGVGEASRRSRPSLRVKGPEHRMRRAAAYLVAVAMHNC